MSKNCCTFAPAKVLKKLMNNFSALIADKCSEINEQVLNQMRTSKVSTKMFAGKELLTLEESRTVLKEMEHPCLYRWLAPKESVDIILSNIEEIFLPELKELLKKSRYDWNGTTYYVLYFGKSIDGRNRIINQHLRSNIHKSTLRHTLYGLCKRHSLSDEKEVEKLYKGSCFQWLPFDEKETEYVICLEAICVSLGNYMLNIDGNPAISQEWREYLMNARK